MPDIWLPIKEPTARRTTVLYIPGADRIDKSKLQELIAKGKEDIHAEAKAEGPLPTPRFSKANVAFALRDFRRYLDRREANGGRPRYY